MSDKLCYTIRSRKATKLVLTVTTREGQPCLLGTIILDAFISGLGQIKIWNTLPLKTKPDGSSTFELRTN